MRGMCTEKNTCLSKLGAEKITFPYFYISPSFGLTDEQNIYSIDAHIKECAQQKSVVYPI